MITQAQIEAAAKVIYGNSNNMTIDYARALAQTALTAAAEVGEHPKDPMGKWDARYSGSAKEIEDHTIERCAQVAENYSTVPDSFGYETKIAIAAAIRALKDS